MSPASSDPDHDGASTFAPIAAPLQRVAVYCASNDGTRPEYLECARSLGTLMAHRGLTVVYGGGRVGLMGALADAALAAGGEVIGVMPHGLVQREVAHHGLTALRVVDSMHERKAMIAELADAFITLPGGLGTIEEFFAGYWAPLLSLLDHVDAEGFLRGSPRDWLVVSDNASTMLTDLQTFHAPMVRRWLRLGET